MDVTDQKDFPTLKAHYRFTKDDEALLLKMKPQLESFADEFMDGFYEFIWGFGKAGDFLKDEAVLKRHRGKVRQWYLDLFGGKYDISYFMKLYKIGEIHVKLGLAHPLCKCRIQLCPCFYPGSRQPAIQQRSGFDG